MAELKYPKGEHVWVGYYSRDGDLLFILTSKEARDWYYLYELKDGAFHKLGKAREPPELEQKFGVYDAVCAATGACKHRQEVVK